MADNGLGEDLFKPKYKADRRISRSEVGDVLNAEPGITADGAYTVERALFEPSAGFRAAYKTYGLQPPSQAIKFTVPELDGLLVYRGLITPDLQRALVRESVVDYLRDSRNKTNLDAHHAIERPIDLFDDSKRICETVTNKKIRQTSLRWVTLGGQYNWTSKVYPSFTKGEPGWPEFPDELQKFLKHGFGINAQAAIVNYYSEGDILSPHQDVAERSEARLVSISLGCECVFYVSKQRYDTVPLSLLLRSGDVVVMGGSTRHAWHGVGRVFRGTSPNFLSGAVSTDRVEFEEWIQQKRVNINVRQMIDE